MDKHKDRQTVRWIDRHRQANVRTEEDTDRQIDSNRGREQRKE
jgi:hypothetical protein